MFSIKKSALVVSLACSAGSVAAASLPEVVEQAILRNPEVTARYHAMRAAEEDQSAARGNWLPRVDLEGFAGRERHDYPGTPTIDYNHPGATLQLRQTIFDGLATWNDVKRAGYTKLTRYYELLGTSDDIALQAAAAYLDVLRYRKLTALARENWATHREVLGQIEDRVKAGVGRRVDLEQAAGRLALAQSNWLTETSNLHDVTQRFARIVGQLPADTLLDAPSVQADLPRDTNPVPNAVAANPTFRAAVASLRSARAETDIRRASNLPSIELRVGQSYDRNLNGAPGTYNSTQAQIVLNYNLFRGGADQARVRQSSEQYYAAVDMRDKTCRDLAQTTAIALNDSRALREQIQYMEQHALSTEKARDAYRQQFDIGQRSLLDLLDTENELFEARRSLTRTRYDQQQADYRVLAAAHQILPALKLAPIAKEAPEEDRRDAPVEDSVVQCAGQVYIPAPLDTAAAMTERPPVRKLEPVAATPLASSALPPGKAEPHGLAADPSIEATVRSWQKAWAGKDLKTYNGFYSSAFAPENDRSLEYWIRFRNRFINKPGPISLELERLAVKQLDKTHAEVSFAQHYRSADFNDDVQKTLVMQLEQGRWKIIREFASPPTVY